jgi:hypothetical protein
MSKVFSVGDIVELDYEALEEHGVVGAYVDWMAGYTKGTTLTVSAVGAWSDGTTSLGFVEVPSSAACYHGPYFKLSGPPRSTREMSTKIIRELKKCSK